MAMQGDVENVGILVENLLGGVAMVNILLRCKSETSYHRSFNQACNSCFRKKEENLYVYDTASAQREANTAWGPGPA